MKIQLSIFVLLTVAAFGQNTGSPAKSKEIKDNSTSSAAISAVAVSGRAQSTVTSVNGMTGAVVLTIPSKTSQLTNDSGFLTSVPTASSTAVGGIKVGSGLAIDSSGTLSATGMQLPTGNISSPTPGVTVTGGTGSAVGNNVTIAIQSATDAQPGLLTAGDHAAFNAKQNALGFTPENVSNKGVANGYAGLNSSGQIPTSQLPAIPSDTAQLTNGAGFVTAQGAASAAPVQSVNGITGNVSLSIPSKTSQLTNDAGFLGPNPVVDLSPGPTINTNAAAGNPSLTTMVKVTLTANATLANPTNPTDGQKIIWVFVQDAAGSRLLTLGPAFSFGTDVTGCALSTAPGKTDYMGAVYNAANNTWNVVSCAKGY